MRVAGFGFTSRASTDSLRSALHAAEQDGPLSAIATLVDKADTQAFQTLASELSVPAIAVPQDAAQQVTTPTISDPSFAARSIASVAEATALAAAGPGARLTASRHISEDRQATCAIAIGDTP